MVFPHLGTAERPFIIGHRGGAGPAHENSTAAFSNAAGNGEERCDGVELDIHVTSDGVLVVHHDPVLRSGERIRELSLDQLRQIPLPDGSTLPTLAEVFDIVGRLFAFVEVKDLPEGADSRLLTLLEARGLDRLQVHSFDHRIVSRLKSKLPALATGVLSCSYPIDPVAQARMAGAGTLWQEWGLIDRPLVESCASEGIALVAWTVNDSADAEALLDLGVVNLCGDWPDRLRRSRRYGAEIKRGDA
jgi:glycerophosphoryl diester phosphodiesterase